MHPYVSNNGELGVILFGGATLKSETTEYVAYNDIWMFDSVKMSWKELETKGKKPTARRGCSSWLVGDDLYVFGGFAQQGDEGMIYYDDMFRFDITKSEWTEVEQVNKPMARRGGVNWTGTQRGDGAVTNGEPHLYLFGGEMRIEDTSMIQELIKIHRCKVGNKCDTAEGKNEVFWESSPLAMCHTLGATSGLVRSNPYASLHTFPSHSVMACGSKVPRLYMFGGIKLDGSSSGSICALDFCFPASDGQSLALLPLQNCKMTEISEECQSSNMKPGKRAFGSAAGGYVVAGASEVGEDEHNAIYRFTGVNWPRGVFSDLGNRAFREAEDEAKVIVQWQKIEGLKIGERNGVSCVHVNGKLLVVGGGRYGKEYYGDTWIADVGAEGEIMWPERRKVEIGGSGDQSGVVLRCDDGVAVETTKGTLQRGEYFKALMGGGFSDSKLGEHNIPFPSPLVSFALDALALKADVESFLLNFDDKVGPSRWNDAEEAFCSIFGIFEFFGFPDYCWDNVEDGLLEALKLEGIGISWSDKSFRNSNSDEEREFQEAQAAVQGAQALVLAFRNIALHGGMKRLLVHVECVMKIASLKAGTLGDTMLF